MKKFAASLAVCALIGSGAALATTPANAVGGGPNCCTGTVNTSILSTHESMVAELKKQDAKQSAMELEVIGQSVKGRDLMLAKFITNPANPTVLYFTQQHGNEALNTEGALDFIKSLGNSNKRLLDKVNILVVPMVNPDGAMGDVNFPLDDYIAAGDRNLTRYNANKVDLNRDHVAKSQPETQALHRMITKYQAQLGIDYAVDLHHQATRSATDGELVSGSILYPTSPEVDPAVVDGSKRLGSVVYNAIEPTGWGHIGKYDGGSATTISRNGIAAEYGISTLLFEMRGMADHEYEQYVLGQKSNGYLIKQTVVTMESTAKAIGDGSINTADTSFWDTLPVQENLPPKKG
ncbi:M14 family zinc carboxypeptidase [Enemella evansiae]|uniref:M14 family zinc carboxypeptidase n=1 Tax=Enemella evansiae TaxID=2016499 RepID=UPI000B97B0AB|nr:M14 family zinc carboxypeptidase [Enemella evansiae]PFG67465.1 zinc carboxypeptidase [Propionibacteriaceae bacterium ES.041]OYN99011.1 carboxypeptidase [Enemella evansiae]OYO01326.1 carboxypeptidase [Enemella evansiae]OYO07424.1 carboxypeptidase [Enemella evansiae]OYO12440.1 carboxypeptidase [Enemella evansiae]